MGVCTSVCVCRSIVFHVVLVPSAVFTIWACLSGFNIRDVYEGPLLHPPLSLPHHNVRAVRPGPVRRELLGNGQRKEREREQLAGQPLQIMSTHASQLHIFYEVQKRICTHRGAMRGGGEGIEWRWYNRPEELRWRSRRLLLLLVPRTILWFWNELK